ncbi:c-type cytochrome [Pseudobacteriovorax antillogorgiicola]|uniref:Cytochrome C oxidase, cbb3-type, subunit III n=1 Tax=Pseudobacteriovorax antillogorgiicola TaxID=1513793 RepID=A0A1Y6BEE8_9BACT|nr:c-type cytochrome [Pseudobacteriovorax antillogorgiicola]TCS56318.1 cbb3-type cytochrome c oxidase subunit III [Pseudobacteriovorax antillogorgiicola]SMF07118.1 Cytochrome C oxidase, cbb3-type, subunit III [Pseudobacteriovorax antillogorgiicola]
MKTIIAVITTLSSAAFAGEVTIPGFPSPPVVINPSEPPTPPTPPTPPGPTPPPSPGDPQPPTPPGGGDDSNFGLSGKEVYLKECAVCHGEIGEGTERGYRIQFPVRGFATYITRHGRKNHPDFDIDMPAYSRELISDQQMREMWDYLHNLPRPRTGKKVYETFCANCHGLDGRGGMSGESVLGELDEVYEYVREGEGYNNYWSRTDYMPRWNWQELPNEEIRMMIYYLYSLGGGYDDDDDDD